MKKLLSACGQEMYNNPLAFYFMLQTCIILCYNLHAMAEIKNNDWIPPSLAIVALLFFIAVQIFISFILLLVILFVWFCIVSLTVALSAISSNVFGRDMFKKQFENEKRVTKFLLKEFVV